MYEHQLAKVEATKTKKKKLAFWQDKNINQAKVLVTVTELYPTKKQLRINQMLVDDASGLWSSFDW